MARAAAFAPRSLHQLILTFSSPAGHFRENKNKPRACACVVLLAVAGDAMLLIVCLIILRVRRARSGELLARRVRAGAMWTLVGLLLFHALSGDLMCACVWILI